MEKNNRIGPIRPYSSNLSLAMKLTTILLILSIFTVQANSYAQKTKVTLDLRQVEMQKVFEKIESLTDFKFLYDNTKIEAVNLVSIRANNQPVSEVLNNLFKGTSIYYLVRHKQIVLKVKKTSLLTPIKEESQNNKEEKIVQNIITGTITDDKGLPLPGANVVEKGTSNGVTADFDGNFSINIGTKSPVLVVSYIGYSTQEINVDGITNVSITLLMDTAGLDEVIIVGYGTQKKINLTGAIGVIDSEELQDRPVASVEEALQGQISGLKVVRTSGIPGNQGISFNIRGVSTFTSNPVLTLVDGVPSSLDRINPNDIESISVLKDAASAAIYGSRAAGGVILVTTKQGKSGQTRISYSGRTGIQSPTRFPKKVSSLQHALISNEARVNDGLGPKFTDQEIALFSSPDWQDTNWEDKLLNDTPIVDHNISLSGGSDNHNYYVSLGYLNQKGIVINSGFERLNVQLNQNFTISDNFKINAKLGYSPSTQNGPASNYLQSVLAVTAALPQIDRIRTDDGKWLSHSTWGDNPIAFASEDGGSKVLRGYRTSGNLRLDYEIFPHFTLSGTYGFVRNQGRERDFRRNLTQYSPDDPNIVSAQTVDNGLSVDNFSDILQNLNLLAKYENLFGRHSVSILGGVTAEWFQQENDFASTRDFLTEDIFTLNAGSSDPVNWNISGGASDWSLASFISRATYSFDDKYLLEGSIRYDGSSRFSEGRRWGLFPSASAGWILSKESFLKENNLLTFLKLRGSWGQVGNQNVGFYPFASTLRQSTYYFNGSPQRGVATGGAPNPLLSWETKESLNIGLEGSILSNILEFNFDVFQEKTSDILLRLPLPTTFGQQEPVQNVGRVDNKGWELELKHRNTIGKDFSYGLSFQVSDATNEVKDLAGLETLISGNIIIEEGHPMNEWYGLRSIGYFQTDDEVVNASFQNPRTSAGDIKFENNGGDPDVINSDDRVRLGRSDPRLPYGIKLNLKYKGLDFSAFGQGVMKHLVWSNGWTAHNFDRENSTLFTHQLDYWTPENPNARFPKVRFGSGAADNGVNDQFSSFWLEDASYFRLKNVELGFTLPQSVSERLGLNMARVYLSGENLLTVTDYLGFDPEIPSGTGSRLVEGRYPLAKVINLGINLNF